MNLDQNSVLVLRTCNPDYTSYGDFKWPELGKVSCGDWDPRPVCGGGLHGLLWGQGDWSLLNHSSDAIWQVVKVAAGSVVAINTQKVKFPEGEVVFCGTAAKAITMVLCHEKAIKDADQASSGDYSKAASSGDYSKAASSGYSSTAASSGYSSTAASSGNSSTAASSGDYSKAASSGYYSTAASSGDYSKAASSGDSSTAEARGEDTIAMAAGLNCRVSAGENGCFAAVYFSQKRQRNVIKTALVGVAGIKPDTQYTLTSAGKWEEVSK